MGRKAHERTNYNIWISSYNPGTMDGAIRVLTSSGASAGHGPDGGTRLQVPAGPRRVYRVAQLDDYRLPAAHFYTGHRTVGRRPAPVRTTCPPGVSFERPFQRSVFFSAANLLPACRALPSFSPPENHLSFRNDRPAKGFIAQTFRSSRLPSWLLLPSALLFPLLALRPAARLLRRIASSWFIRDDSAAITGVDWTEWHHYGIGWEQKKVVFEIDRRIVFESGVSPVGPLGLVI
jgi:hypothetical protein